MREAKPKSTEPHPIWRGIGCFIIIVVPVLSFAAADLSLPFFLNRGLVPKELLVTPATPDWMWTLIPGLAPIFQFLFGRYAIGAILILTVLFIIILGGIFSVLYSFMYRTVAPSRYGPMDAPPPKVKVKKYKR